MSLYNILSKRGCINILKSLYDEEVINKTAYTLNLSQVVKKLKIDLPLVAEIDILSNDGLISSEKIDKEYVLSITKKGKKIILKYNKFLI